MNYGCTLLTLREYSEGSGDYFYCLKLKSFIFPLVEDKCKGCTLSRNSSESCLASAKQAETNSVSLVSTAGLITSKTNN